MSDSSQVRLTIGAESSFGSGPGVTPPGYSFRFSRQSLRDSVGQAISSNIRSDANVDDSSKVTRAVGGNISADLYPDTSGALYQAIEATLRTNTNTSTTIAEGAVTLDAGAKTLTHSSSWPANIIEGDIIQISSADNEADNRWVYVTDITGATLTFQSDSNNVGSDAVQIVRPSRMSNGVAERSFWAEVARLDVAQYQVFNGVSFGSFSMSVVDGQITGIDFGIAGKDSTRGTSAIAGATYNDAPVTPTMDPLDLQTLFVGGVAYPAQSINLAVNNAIAPRRNVGEEGPVGVRFGRCAVSGSINAYFDDWTTIDEFISDGESNIWWVMEDANGDGYGVAIHRTKWSSAGVDTTGPDTDEIKALSFSGMYDEEADCSITFFIL